MRDFNHTVNVLVKAYMNDTLEHGNCYACAVGNIIADCTGTKLIREKSKIGCEELKWDDGSKYPAYDGREIYGWGGVFTTEIDFNEDDEEEEIIIKQLIEKKNYTGIAKYQIDSTGYTVEELARIEYAFESIRATSNKYEKEIMMFNGLMEVLDVLADIHGININEKEEAKKLFVKS